MHSPNRPFLRSFLAFGLMAAVVAGAFGVTAHADDKPAAGKAAASGPQMFDSAVAAAKALVEAAEANDTAKLRAIMGPGSASYVQDGGDAVVALERKQFAEAAKKQARLEDNKDGSQTLVVGDKDWPLPFPLRSKDGKFWWDGPAGVEEMRMRRIGRNELRAIDMMGVFVEAQIEYAGKDRDGDEVREYAQRLRSSAGKQDGLYWETAEDEPMSPLGPFVNSWRDQLGRGSQAKSAPFGGYYYRILTGQGTSAPGGRHSYVINGNMIAGFALIAYPAEYGVTGIMSIMVSHHGKVYERDLGRCTAQCVQQMRGFNPSQGWTEVKGN